MTNVKILLFLTLLLATKARALDTARWTELMKIVQQEISIIEKSTSHRPRLQHRLLELYTERLKLIHDKDNRTFLGATKEEINGKKKADFFAETRKHYDLTKDYGLSMLKADEANPYRSEIGYLLGLNSRDYSNSELTEKMLLLSIESAGDLKANHRHLAESALAEYYYNEKRFAEAIPYYERISSRDDAWKAKHTYNLSWCYLKERDFPKAMASMQLALDLNQREGMVKIPDQLLESLSSFYAYVGKPLLAMQLYLTRTKEPVSFLLSLATKASEKGMAAETATILAATQKFIREKKVHQHQEALYHAYLDYFRQYNRDEDHHRLAVSLTRYYTQFAGKAPFKSDLKTDTIKKFRSMAGFLQLKLTKDIKENKISYDKKNLTAVLNYYDHLTAIDPENKGEYIYFAGESNYSVGVLSEAAARYSETLSFAEAKRDLELARKAVISLLDLTAKEKLGEEINKKYLRQAYTFHVKYWPTDENSRIIFPKLFQVHYQAGSDALAAGVLVAYHRAFPGDIKRQQGLMTHVLDQLIEQRNVPKLSAWLRQIKGGFLAFDQDTVQKLEHSVGSILFGQNQELAKKGEHSKAAEGFRDIHAHPLYSTKIKADAAHFASLAFLEALDVASALKWHAEALALMTPEEQKKMRPQILRMAERSAGLQDFKAANHLAGNLLRDHCEMKDDLQQRSYELTVMVLLAAEKNTEALEVVRSNSKCLPGKEAREIAVARLYDAFERSRQSEGLRSLVELAPELKAREAATLTRWFWEKNSPKLLSELKNLGTPESKTRVQEIALLEEARLRARELSKSVIWEKAPFDAEAFNASVEKHLLAHQDFKQKFAPLLRSGEPELLIQASSLFAQVYAELSRKINALSPEGVEPETLMQIKTAMGGLSAQFDRISKDHQEKLRKFVDKELPLTRGSRNVASVLGIPNPVRAPASTFTMDKAGAP